LLTLSLLIYFSLQLIAAAASLLISNVMMELHFAAHRRSVAHTVLKRRSPYLSSSVATVTAVAKPTARLSMRGHDGVSIVVGKEPTGVQSGDDEHADDDSNGDATAAAAAADAHTKALRHLSGDAVVGYESVSGCGRPGQLPRWPVAAAIVVSIALTIAGVTAISFDFFFKGLIQIVFDVKFMRGVGRVFTRDALFRAALSFRRRTRGLLSLFSLFCLTL
jgi:hypothetical protein